MTYLETYKNMWDHIIIKVGDSYTFSDGELPSITLETKNGKLVNKRDHPYFGETVEELLEGYKLIKEG